MGEIGTGEKDLGGVRDEMVGRRVESTEKES
jgi:hypothetical protein